MDPNLLQQFRQQLAVWIEARLESQRLPFQRLELCPDTLTDLGRLTPDFVLWINRDSQLAGTMILLPDNIDDHTLAEGLALCKALGLGHFTTWAAREVSIWSIVSGEPERLCCFPLPAANQITPQDFQNTLDELLEQLKVVTLTNALPTTGYSSYYFANLCLRNLDEITPGLMISARRSAGEIAADEWLEQAPGEKAWMSLWRILFLIWHGRLPPGLQPDRLELAIHYALTDLTSGQLTWLEILDSEPPLPEDVAVRLHHLASRLRQLGWPHNDGHARELIQLLLNEAAHRLGLKTLPRSGSSDESGLYVACQPPPSADSCYLVAPRAYIAGWVMRTTQEKSAEVVVHAENLQSLGATQHFTSAAADLQEKQPLSRKQREDHLLFLRKAWPSRRFDLPRNAPAWLWDALYLAGLVSNQLSLTLPHDWHLAPGVLQLWRTLEERYQLAEIVADESGAQSLHFIQGESRKEPLLVYRDKQIIEVASKLSKNQKPGTIQVWLKASEEVLELLLQKSMSAVAVPRHNEPEAQNWGLHIFLQTRLGNHLWQLCSEQVLLPEINVTADSVLTYGVPVPSESILSDLSMLGSQETQVVPPQELLEREFSEIFGVVPPLPASPGHTISGPRKPRRRKSASTEKIAAKVFEDGLPRFPEHYLMHLYRPALKQYELFGPLEITEEFFERITLKTADQHHTIEVTGKIVAEALVLASYTKEPQVTLPVDEKLLDEVVLHYKADLERLWDNLVRECRRFEPYRQSAIKLARTIWQQHALPPVVVQ